MSSGGYEAFKLSYEISPVILVNGIANLIPGQMLPIVALTEAASFTQGLLQGPSVPNLDQFFAHWKPVGGSTLVAQEIGMFPFANQAVAANAVIAQPLNVSMLMMCPVQQEAGYTSKLATLTVLKQTLAQHNSAGGTYTVVTPMQIYTNCLLLKVTDVSSGESKQVQYELQFDFLQPLIQINQLAQVYNSLMAKMAGGLPTPQIPTWSGPSATFGNALPQAAGGVIPSVSNNLGSMAGSVSQGAGANQFGFVA
ncbi:hypothetical protein [Paraburkholderia sp. DHOC27]|uniref:hypothetical protein n=1 Tax=Paraburkholderia sp. DHOC27 TaxID=2303330 RepID=UPI0015F2F78E|nr:hypothetical protein [Paraburkholderia sp. DHOC27]